MKQFMITVLVAIALTACTNEKKQEMINGEIKETGLPAAADQTPNPNTADTVTTGSNPDISSHDIIDSNKIPKKEKY